MPVSMQHGEIATFRLGNTIRVNNPDPAVERGQRSIRNITKANPGVVTTSHPHGFSNGDKVVFRIGDGMRSMHQLHWKVATVAGATSNTFQLSNIDTSSFASFDGRVADNLVTEHVTLNAGGRGAYPVLMDDAAPATTYGAYLAQHAYINFSFDKNLVGDRDIGPGSG